MNPTKMMSEEHTMWVRELWQRTGVENAPPMHPKIRTGIAKVLDDNCVTWGETFGKKNVRNPPALRAKREICWHLRKAQRMSYRRMGELLGLDHATMIYHTKIVDEPLRVAS